jgi:hypothetical protein
MKQLEDEVAAEKAKNDTSPAGVERLRRLEGERENVSKDVQRKERVVQDAGELADALWAKYLELATGEDDSAAKKSPQELEDQIKQLSRLVWFGSLSDSDVISVGMTETTDPYQFRKLVFWASASNIDLNQFSTEIDGVVDSVTQIAGAFRQQAKQRAAQRQAGQHALGNLIGMLPLTPEQKAALTGVLGTISPLPAAPPAPTSGGSP